MPNIAVHAEAIPDPGNSQPGTGDTKKTVTGPNLNYEEQQPATRDAEIITLVGLAHGMSHFFHLILPPLFPWLMKDFHLTFTRVGFPMTVFFAISGIGQSLAGFVVDHVGPRRVMFVGLALLVAAGFTLGLAHSYPMLLLTLIMAGVVNVVFDPVDFALLNRHVLHHRP